MLLHQMTMTMIVPFTFVCDTCHDFNYIGKKSAMKVEKIRGEDHFGVSTYRFYGKCCNCAAAYTFKSDPASQGYVMESGGPIILR